VAPRGLRQRGLAAPPPGAWTARAGGAARARGTGRQSGGAVPDAGSALRGDGGRLELLAGSGVTPGGRLRVARQARPAARRLSLQPACGRVGLGGPQRSEERRVGKEGRARGGSE